MDADTPVETAYAWAVDRPLPCAPGAEPQYRCPYANCGKLFGKRFNLKAHCRKHSGDRPFVCSFPGCTRSFMWKSSLSSHEAGHARRNSENEKRAAAAAAAAAAGGGGGGGHGMGHGHGHPPMSAFDARGGPFAAEHGYTQNGMQRTYALRGGVDDARQGHEMQPMTLGREMRGSEQRNGMQGQHGYGGGHRHAAQPQYGHERSLPPVPGSQTHQQHHLQHRPHSLQSHEPHQYQQHAQQQHSQQQYPAQRHMTEHDATVQHRQHIQQHPQQHPHHHRSQQQHAHQQPNSAPHQHQHKQHAQQEPLQHQQHQRQRVVPQLHPLGGERTSLPPRLPHLTAQSPSAPSPSHMLTHSHSQLQHPSKPPTPQHPSKPPTPQHPSKPPTPQHPSKPPTPQRPALSPSANWPSSYGWPEAPSTPAANGDPLPSLLGAGSGSSTSPHAGSAASSLGSPGIVNSPVPPPAEPPAVPTRRPRSNRGAPGAPRPGPAFLPPLPNVAPAAPPQHIDLSPFMMDDDSSAPLPPIGGGGNSASAGLSPGAHGIFGCPPTPKSPLEPFSSTHARQGRPGNFIYQHGV